MNKRTKFHFQNVIRLPNRFLYQWCFISFLCITISAVAQNPEEILDYAEENVLLHPNEVVEISRKFLQRSNHTAENQCKAYLLKAEANMLLQQYDEALNDVFKIDTKHCKLKIEEQFALLLLENQIYSLLDLESYQKETAKKLQDFLQENNIVKKKKLQKRREIYENYFSLISALQENKTVEKITLPTLEKEDFSKNTYLTGIYLFLQSLETQNPEELNFKNKLQQELELPEKDFEEIYYRYFALYEAQYLLQKNKKEKAYELLQNTLAIVKNVEGLSYYKRNINAELIAFGIEQENKELTETYKDAELNFSAEVDLVLTQTLTNIFAHKTSLNVAKQNAAKANQKIILRTIILIGGGLTVALIVYIFRLKWLEKHYAKVANYIESLTAEKADVKEKAAKIKKKIKTSKSLVSKEVEEQILSGLENFEKEEMFLQKNISLAYLASKLKMNTKYLSEVLNSRLNENFNGYINRLRVEYIVNKLKNDPQYLKYKISYLAEVSGYSSHSSFSTAFKAVTGMPPTKFISYLKRKI